MKFAIFTSIALVTLSTPLAAWWGNNHSPNHGYQQYGGSGFRGQTYDNRGDSKASGQLFNDLFGEMEMNMSAKMKGNTDFSGKSERRFNGRSQGYSQPYYHYYQQPYYGYRAYPFYAPQTGPGVGYSFPQTQ